MMSTQTPALLSPSLIESVVNALPVQGRIMMRLILLQHFDVTEEDVQYMAADRPDPRCVAGSKPIHNILTQEAIKAVRDRRDQYLRQVRLKRERTWLQCETLKKLLALRMATAERAESLLSAKFSVPADTIAELKSQARTAVPRPAVRALDQRWEASEISSEDYQRQRLGIEMQFHLRMAEKYRKRLDLAQRERQGADHTPLQDHELGHIWGIPAGSLAARKVKYMAQFLQNLQTAMHAEHPSADAIQVPIDLWKETFAILATRPVERSLPTYDGLERTESNLNEKLTALAAGTMAEDAETKFWLSIVQGASTNAVHSEITRNLFGLQRFDAILNDTDATPETLDEVLMARVTPKSKEEPAQLTEANPADSEANQMREHVLKSMFGEQHPDLYGGGKW
ncbi:hypothetical protein W02_02770 [Nitrospira sp. KM1]|uniref:hypothetical protein n=1 Tax=Nitrospira sp. KM1 TaxID=1936990 RepID=UPI0013A7810A|nr:hypothetical protein [Nitrospira sp. KM1]BCA53137.1 hypothetical protein W02_02770 [Nitrospira sp. KM1]